MSNTELDPRFRAGAEDYQLGDEEDQNLTDFGNELEPETSKDTPADPPADDEAPKDPPPSEDPPKDTPADPPASEDPPADGEQPGKPRNPMIPRARFDEVNAKLREAKARLAELEARSGQQPPAPQPPAESPKPDFDFDAKESEYMEAVLDGDKEKALKIRKEIRAAELALVPKPSEQQPKVDVEQVKAAIKFDEAVAELNAKYPVFDPKSDVFDEDLVDEAVALSGSYQRRGVPPHEAIRRAVEKVVKANGLDVPDEAPKDDTPPPPPAQPKKEPPKPDPKDVKKKIEAAAQQPPKPDGKAVPEPNIDLDSMTEEEFAALPPATLARLRGDYM